MPSSLKCVPGSTSFFNRSCEVSHTYISCDSMALGPPPWQICSSSFLIWVTRSTTLRLFFAKSSDLALMLVFRTDADTRKPQVEMVPLPRTELTAANVSVYGLPRCCARARVVGLASWSVVCRLTAQHTICKMTPTGALGAPHPASWRRL